MKLSKTQTKTVVTTLLALVFVCAYGFLFVVIKTKNNQISILQNQVDVEIRKDQRLYSVKQLMTDLHEGFDKIDTYFVSNDGVVGFLENLESFGAMSGVYVGVNSVSVDGHIDDGLPYESLRVEFVARGEWRSVIQLISLLETTPFGITVERMQLERLEGSDYWRINTSFTVLKLK